MTAEWALPTGRYVSAIDFDFEGWLPVTTTEASIIEGWGGDIVFMTQMRRLYWAKQEDALAARTIINVGALQGGEEE